MKRVRRTAQALVTHVATIAALYFGFFQKIEGAENVGLFLVWASFVIAVGGVCFYGKSAHVARENWPAQWLMWPFRLVTLTMLVWFGHWLVGTASALTIIITAALYADAKKRWIMA